MMLEIPDSKEVFTGELLERGIWVTANIGGSIFWPVTKQEFEYHGRTLHIIPVTKDRYPGVTTKISTQDEAAEARKTISNFLSAINWVNRQSLTIEGWSGGSSPHPYGIERQHRALVRQFDLSYLPEPQDKDGRLALALFREGGGLNHPGYAFLSYHRIVERKHHNSKNLIAWVNDTLNKVNNYQTNEVIARLQTEQSDVGKYMYASYRCAVAHAKNDPVADPDDPEIFRLLQRDLPLMRALAEYCIETEYGIETFGTQHDRHLYELAGFKKLFGDELIEAILRGDEDIYGHMVDVPPIRIELANRPTYGFLSALHPVGIQLFKEGPTIDYESEDKRVRVSLSIDLTQERLDFNPHRDLKVVYDWTSEGAAIQAEHSRFLYHYYLNGALRVFSLETDELLSRKDPFMPVNIMVDPAGSEAIITRWEREAERLKQWPWSYGRVWRFKYDPASPDAK